MVMIFPAKSAPMPERSVSFSGAFFQDLHQRLSQIPYRDGGSAIGPNSERIISLQLQQVGNFIKDLGDFGILHGISLFACPNMRSACQRNSTPVKRLHVVCRGLVPKFAGKFPAAKHSPKDNASPIASMLLRYCARPPSM
jgi:hypothetical protein